MLEPEVSENQKIHAIVVQQSYKNIFTMVAGSIFCFLVSKFWLFGARILIVLFSVMALLECLHVIIVLNRGRMMRKMAAEMELIDPTMLWLKRAECWRIAVLVIASILIFLLFSYIW